MKVLLVTMYFPPAGGGGVQRPLKFATHLPAQGIETHVLAPDDPKWIHVDDELQPPTQAWVHRARYVGPQSRRLAERLRAANVRSRLVELPWATHGFDYNFSGPGGQLSTYAVERFLAAVTR